jgi:hypothetical protein
LHPVHPIFNRAKCTTSDMQTGALHQTRFEHTSIWCDKTTS